MKHILEPLIERISDTDNFPVQSRIEGLDLCPAAFTDTADNIIDIEAEIDKKYHGLLLDTPVVKDAKSKARASHSLSGWRYVQQTSSEWIAHLYAGHTIQPSTFIANHRGDQ